VTSTTVVDTNVVLRHLLRDDERLYQRAREFFGRVQDAEEAAFFPDSVIAECIYVLDKRYHVERDEIVTRLLQVLDFRGVAPENRDLLRGALTIYRSRNIDFVDAVAAAIARGKGWKLMTFDRLLGRLAK